MNHSRALMMIVILLPTAPAAARTGTRRLTTQLPASAFHYAVRTGFASAVAGTSLQSTQGGTMNVSILPAAAAVLLLQPVAPSGAQIQVQGQAAGGASAAANLSTAARASPSSAGERIPLPKDCESTARWGQLTVHRSWGCFDSILTGERRPPGRMLSGGHAVLYFPEAGDNRSVIGAGHAVAFTALPHWGWGRFLHVGSSGILTTHDACQYEERIVDEFGAPVTGCDASLSGDYSSEVLWAVKDTPGWAGGSTYRATNVPLGGLTSCMLEPYRTYFYTIKLTRYEESPPVREKLCGTTLDAYDESWLCALPETNGQGACEGSGVPLYGR